MTNTLIILAVLGVINLLVRKFASGSKDPESALGDFLKKAAPRQAAQPAIPPVNAVAPVASQPAAGKPKRIGPHPVAVTMAPKVIPPIAASAEPPDSVAKPISEVDSLIASRLGRKAPPIASVKRQRNAMPTSNLQSIRLGMVMAEVLSPPVALRSRF